MTALNFMALEFGLDLGLDFSPTAARINLFAIGGGKFPHPLAVSAPMIIILVGFLSLIVRHVVIALIVESVILNEYLFYPAQSPRRSYLLVDL